MKNLMLDEILWEITDRCNKGCKYCGSKDCISDIVKFPVEEEEYTNIAKIASAIIQYPPKTITLTGGEPSCLDYKFLADTIIRLRTKMKVNLLTNGKLLFDINEGNSLAANIGAMLDVIGISVNNMFDVSKMNSDGKVNDVLYAGKTVHLAERMTIVTNFGTHNIWDFAMIASFVASRNLTWQVQLTMGEFQLPFDGIKHLLSLIGNLGYGKIVLADNLQPVHDCTAGINSCGILYNGDVVPCLSMRTWLKDKIYDESEGNITLTGGGLKHIWEDGFKKRRFAKCNCCRDFINLPDPIPLDGWKEIITDEWKKMYPPDGTGTIKHSPYSVQIYGCAVPQVTIYGVASPGWTN